MLHDQPAIVWIKDNKTLNYYCQRWLKLKRIALDTEFIRANTYYPLPGLIQLNTGDGIYLIDPLSISQWQPFREILEHPGILKILHSCSEDLDVFQELTGGSPQPLYDTQLAAAYANKGFSIGYQRLVQILLGLELPKGETRSDWRQRPLTDAQIQYAALDVIHLLDIHRLLDQAMAEKEINPASWLADDCRQMQSAIHTNDPYAAWVNVKRAWQLQPQQLAVLQALCYFQDTEARKRNVPRNRVIPKGSLWALARYQPNHLNALYRIPDLRSHMIKKDGQAILSVIKAAANIPQHQWPKALAGPLPKIALPFGKAIKQFIVRQAEALGLPVEIILPSKVTTAILSQWVKNGYFSLPDNLQCWRREVVGEPLIQWLNQQAQNEAISVNI